MSKQLHLLTYIASIISFSLFMSCDTKHSKEDFSAYFGGEIINPQSKFVLFLKDNEVLDTIFLDKDNRFLHKFDSLAPGLYTFKHYPEYQYIYYGKNDSLMLIINTNDFDNSIVFCGRGHEKNNYLMEMFLANEVEKSNVYDLYFRDSKDYIKSIDSSYKVKKKIYDKFKSKVDWDLSFDTIALASLNLPYYLKKEVYPYAHKFITGKNVINELPKDYYKHRDIVDLDNSNLSNFYLYHKYTTALLNNVVFTEKKGNISEFDLENNFDKLEIANNFIKNKKNKNSVLHRMTYFYLMENKNLDKTKDFVDKYLKYSSDKEMQNEIKEIYSSFEKLKVGNKLPKEEFLHKNNKPVNFEELIKRQTVLFFITTKAESNFEAAHKKVNDLKLKYPNTDFIAVDLDDSIEKWHNKIDEMSENNITEIFAVNYENTKKKFVIHKLGRTLILNADGTIKNAFVDLFDVNFEDNLK
jgi:hypothetical protein